MTIVIKMFRRNYGTSVISTNCGFSYGLYCWRSAMKVYYEKSLGMYSWWTPLIVPSNYKEVLSFITVLDFNFWVVICWTGCESICPLPEMTILVARFPDMPSQVHWWTQISFSIPFFDLYLHVTESQTLACMIRLDTYSNENTCVFGICKHFLEAKY
jgi:hypothetical protein